MTNFERIKEMSVEGLAEIINDIYKQGYIDCLHDEQCVEAKEIINYLKSEITP